MFKKTLPFLLFFFAACQKEFKSPVKTDSISKNGILADQSKPNIILFIADDLGYYAPEFTGGQSYSTPSLNFMANNGMRFTNCNSHPDGYPSRLALMTGKYNFRNYTFWGNYPAGEPSIGNLLKNNGYENCYVGKWQLNGGDNGIRALGFDNYLVYLPFISGDQRIRRYKNPLLYRDSAFLPDEATAGRYSEDMFYDYVDTFITSRTGDNPFFITYSFNLCAAPYVPAPNHPDYAAWNPDEDRDLQDTSYFRSMVEYMDYTIGRIIDKVEEAGFKEETLILFLADNATQEDIITTWNGISIKGTKTETTLPGTLTPLVAYWPGKVNANKISTTISDYTDFFKTFADLSDASDLSAYGALDGISLADDLLSVSGEDRSWAYCWWKNSDFKPLEEFIFTEKYKYYRGKGPNKNFFNLKTDIWERNPIPESQMTPREVQIKAQLKAQIESIRP
jgi:arylsulfatase A